MLGRPVTGRAAPAGAGEAGPAPAAAGPVDRVDGDAAGGVAEGGGQQRVHATCAPSVGAVVARWWACQAASSSAWIAAWTARAASRRIISGVPHKLPSPSRLPGKGKSQWTSAKRPLLATKPWARSWV